MIIVSGRMALKLSKIRFIKRTIQDRSENGNRGFCKIEWFYGQ